MDLYEWGLLFIFGGYILLILSTLISRWTKVNWIMSIFQHIFFIMLSVGWLIFFVHTKENIIEVVIASITFLFFSFIFWELFDAWWKKTRIKS